MKQKLLLLLTWGIIFNANLKAQLNVGSTAPADVSAILQATSTTKGFLPPVMTTAQINAIVLPANGLTVFNSTLNQLQVNVGTAALPSWSVAAGSVNTYWSPLGNTGTVAGTNFIGTTDNVALSFATNGAEHLRIDPTGNVGIGTLTPAHTLEINGSAGITGTNTFQFGSGVAGQAAAAGTIGYQTYTAGALDIIGAGATTRLVKLWDNVTLPGTLTVGTTATAANTDDLLTVNGTGVVSRRTVASLATQTPDVNIYSTDGSLAANRTVQLAGHTLTFNGNAGGFTGGLNILSGNAGLWSMMGFGRTGIEGSIGITAGAGQILSAAQTGDMMLQSGANNMQIGTNGAGAVVLSTTGAERFRITPSGNIGISTSTPLTLLSITPGSVGAKITLFDGGSATSHYGFGISNSQLNYDATGDHVFYTGGKNGTGAEGMRINTSGVSVPVRLIMSNNLNLFVGANTGLVTTAQGNTFVGIGNGQNNTTGANNTFSGYQSGLNNTTGVSNVFYGFQSGFNNTITSNNLFMGFQSGFSNVNVNNNQFVGFQSGYTNTSGFENTFTGAQTGYGNTSGIDNTFTGHWSGKANTTGSYNTFHGWHSGVLNTTGAGNVFYGHNSGQSTTTGNSNVFIGLNSGVNNSTGTLNSAIGDQAGPATAALTNTTSIGANTQATVSNTVILGTGASVGIGTTTPAHNLEVNGSVGIISTNVLEFGSGVSPKDGAAGRIGYQAYTAGALDIVGAGTNGANRVVKLWDNVILPGTLTVGTTATAPNSDDLLTINGSGILSRRTVASLATQTPDVSIYSTDGTIAANRTVQLAGRTLTFNGIAGNTNGGLSLLSGNAGAWSMMGFGRTGIEGSIGINAQGGQYLPASTGDFMIWTGSNNIHIGANGAGAVVLSTGAAEHFRLANNGNVGINNGNPSQALQVNGVIRSGSDNSGSIQLVPGNGSQAGYLRFYRGDGVTSPGYIGYNNSNILYQAENGASHQFNGTAIFNNNVGIYTSTPSQALQVNGNVKAGLDNVGSAWLSQGNNSNQSGYLSIYKPDGVSRMGYIGADNTRMFYNAENGVQHYFAGGQAIFENSMGIGTSTPSYKLDVVGAASNTIIRVGDGGSGGGMYFGNGNHGVQRGFPTLGSNNNVGLYTTGSNVYLSTAGTNTNQFVLTNGGNVGINMGATAPSRILQVNASIKAGLDNNSSIILNGGSNRTGYIELYRGDGTTRMGYIGDDPNNLLYQAENGASHYFGGGNVIVGTALGVRMAPSYTIDVSGNVRSSFDMNASAFNLTSDRRLKRNITPINSALDKVMQLTPYSYEKKATLAATSYNQKEMGFIAQDVRKILPDLITVGKDSDKILAINYMAIIPLLTKAIQEQQAQNDTQIALNKRQQTQNELQTAFAKQQAAEIATLKKENIVIAAQLSEMKELKLAVAQLRSELNKTTVTRVAVPIPVTAN